MEEQSQFNQIVKVIQEKTSLKQEIYRNTINAFGQFKECAESLIEELKTKMDTFDKDVAIEFSSKGDFEFQLKVGGDIILFYMHTNVFDFPQTHPMKQTAYIKEDNMRSYCGLINIYNFLADSFKYNRFQDSGYLIGRAFINKDNHFFMEGKRQLNFLYNNITNDVIDKTHIHNIIQQALLYSMDFDLYTPPYQHVQEISVANLLQEASGMRLKTAKRLGFKFTNEEEPIVNETN